MSRDLRCHDNDSELTDGQNLQSRTLVIFTVAATLFVDFICEPNGIGLYVYKITSNDMYRRSMSFLSAQQ